jgi:PAS domain S-box-containing protein
MKSGKSIRGDSLLSDSVPAGDQQLESYFQLFFNKSSELFCVISEDGYFRLLSQAWQSALGYPINELTAKPYFTFLYAEDIKPTIQKVRHAIQKKKKLKLTNRIFHQNGELKRLEWTGWTMNEDHLMFAIVRDITSEKQADEAFKYSYEYTRELIEVSLDPLVTIHPNGQITDVNTATEKITGYSRSELIGSDFSSYFTEPEKAHAGYEQAFRDGIIRDYELTICHRDGRQFSVIYNAAVFRNREGEITGIFASARDISDRKISEQKIKESEEQYRLISDFTYDWEILRDKTGKLLYSSPSMERITGYKNADFIHGEITLMDLVHPDDYQKTLQNTERALSGETIPAYEFRIISKSNEILYLVSAIQPVIVDGSLFVGYRESLRDVTVQKKAELEIRELNEKLEQKIKERTAELIVKHEELDNFFSVSLDLLSIVDTSGKFIRVNNAWENILGYRISEIENRKFLDFVHPDDIDATLGILQTLLDHQPLSNFTNRYKCKDGTYRFIEWQSVPVGKLFYSAARDVTERLNKEEELKTSNERLKLATRAGGVGIWDYNIATNILLWDNQMLKLYGIEKNSLELKYETWLQLILPEDAGKLNNEIQMAIQGKKDFDLEFRVCRPDGSVHTLRGLATVLHDKSGQAIRMIGTNWDITSQKNIENELIKAREEEKLASNSKSEFLSRMSHELRTPLNAILGFAQLLKMGELNPTQRKSVDRIFNGGKNLLELINEVLDITHIDSGMLTFSLKSVNINEIIAESVQSNMSFANQKQVALLMEKYNQSDYLVNADRNRLKQVLDNLINNAVKYNKTNGSVAIKIDVLPDESQPKKIRVLVCDTGQGISDDDLNKLFKPFERIRVNQSGEEGTGLGLAVVKKMMTAMNGTVGVESKLETGSTFWIELPFADQYS